MYKLMRRILKIFLNFKSIGKIPGLSIGENLILKGKPIIQIHSAAKVLIGNCVTLNSSNDGYHINMHSPVKLMADRENAVITIGDNSRIHGTCIHAYNSISIGKNCLIAANCQIFDSNGHEVSFEDVSNRINTESTGKPIVIEDNVWIGANTIILPGVRIGNGSIISAGSIVKNDIPPMVIGSGNPAKVVITAEQWLTNKINK